jgi:ABC-type sugar transport system ATPase subunit
LEELIRRLRRQGVTILYVSHRMEEVFRICDRVTVLRDGQHVATTPLAETTADDVVRMMIGRQLAQTVPEHLAKPLGAERLRAVTLSSPGKFRDVSFTLHAGEVLGMAGLVGSGRSEVVQGIFGLDPQTTGQVFVDGRSTAIRHPQQAMAVGIGLVSEDRKRQGIVPDMSCLENATLAAIGCPAGAGAWQRLLRCPLCPRSAECLQFWGLLRLGRERRWALDCFQRLRLRAASPHVPIATLSGGNQQKVMLSRCLLRRCGVIILDEPTRGVDVGAKAEIHRFIDELASAGHAVLLISSELPEVLQLSTRILVMREGRVAHILDRADATEERVMQWMAGV